MTSLPEMPCRDFVECVTLYLEGGLPLDDVVRLEAHLAECDDCRLYLEQLRATMAASGRVEVDRLDDHAKEHLLDAFRAITREPRP